MRHPKSFGTPLPQFAAALAALGILILAVHPILAQARTESRRLSAFHPNTAFQMYAVDVDGGYGDFEGKPILTDRLDTTLALYGVHPALPRAKKSAKPQMGCMPIVFFKPSSNLVSTGSLTFWEGQVSNAAATCSIYPVVEEDSVLVLPDWGSVPTDVNGNFWLVAGALEQGVGTINIETQSGAMAESSVLVLDR